jgi:hypothetical protein
MAGQGRILLVLGGVLAAGIAAAIFAVSDASSGASSEGDAPQTAGAAASDAADSSERPGGGARRARKAGTASVVGEVVRSKGKVPVPDQEVLLIPEKGDPYATRTDAQGVFKLADVLHGGPYELRIAAAGCGTIRIPGIALDRGEKRDVGRLFLDPSVAVTVQVRSWSDMAVEGALIEAYVVAQADNFDWTKAYAQMGQAPVAVARATTDARGEALFAELAVGRWTFVARKEGYGRGGRSGVSIRSDASLAPVKLYLGSGHALSGRVFDATKSPLAGALVMTAPGNSGWDLGGAPMRGRATTDGEGRYEFASLEAGDTQILVARPGGLPSPAATVRIPNVARFDITLKGTATLAGVVSEKEGGKPLEGVLVRAWSWTGNGTSIAEATSDSEGKYALSVAAGNVGQLVTEKEGWAPVDEPGRPTQIAVREGDTATRDLKMRPGAKLSGVVRGPGGPLAGAKVWAMTANQWGGLGQKSASSDSAGRYEFTSLAPGRTLVRADLAGWYVKDLPDNYWMIAQQPGPSPFKVEVLEGAAATKDVDMVRGTTVSGRVEGPQGPLEGVRVSTSMDPEGGVLTGGDGAFSVEGVKPGPQTWLLAQKDGYAVTSANKPFAVAADQPTTGIVLRMTPVGVVRGTVTVADGSPLRDGKVSVNFTYDRGDAGMERDVGAMRAMSRGGPGGAGQAAPIHSDGSYEIPLTVVKAGKFRVTVTSLDRPAATSEPVPIVDGQSDYVVNVTVDGGKDLTGRVVVKQGGAAVPGALISVQPRGRGPVGGMSMVETGGGGGAVWAVADGDGRFAIAQLAAGNYSVTARAEGYVAAAASVDLATSNTVTVEVEPELAIEGVVMFADGSPVEGATIGVARDAPGGAVGSGNANFYGGQQAASGAGGRFRVGGLASGNWRLNVSAGWQGDLNIRTKRTDPIAAGATDVKVVVETGGVIFGRVLDPRGKGVAALWVYGNPEPKDGKPVEGAEGRNARTREDGSFSLLGLTDATTYQVNVTANQGWDSVGGATWKNAQRPGVVVGARNLEIVLEEGLQIVGVLVDADGKALANTYLSCSQPQVGADGKGRSSQVRNAITDGAGAFLFGGLDAGDCRIVMQEMGVGSPGAGLVVQNGDKVAAGARDVRLVATKGATISGVVVDEQGTAVRGAWVYATPHGGGAQNRNVRTQEDGAFEVTGLAGGASYDVTASSQDRPAVKREEVVGGSGGLRIVLPKGVDASGRVVDEAGVAVKQGMLMLRMATDNAQSKNVQTDENGGFKIQGLLADAVYDAQVYVPTSPNKGYRKCGRVKGGESGIELHVEP